MTDLALLHGELGLESDEYKVAVYGVIRRQSENLLNLKLPKVACPCGRSVSVNHMYRCFHCGIYWCLSCARKHFGRAARLG